MDFVKIVRLFFLHICICQLGKDSVAVILHVSLFSPRFMFLIGPRIKIGQMSERKVIIVFLVRGASNFDWLFGCFYLFIQ